ncbi:MAG TPA: AsmA family protein, partial [Rhodanobacter sp.]
MRRRRKLLAWGIGIPLVLVVVLVAALALFDWNRLKPTIDARVSTAIGRPFAINGDLDVHWHREPQAHGLRAWLPWPQVVANDVTVANPPWAKQPEFVRLDALRFSLSPLDLLLRRVRIPSLQLVHPRVGLERDKQGRANWTFNLPQSNTPSAWTLDLGAIGFDAGRLALNDAVGRVKIDARIEPLQQAIPYDQVVAQATADARVQAISSAGRGADQTMRKMEEQNHPEDATARQTRYQFA